MLLCRKRTSSQGLRPSLFLKTSNIRDGMMTLLFVAEIEAWPKYLHVQYIDGHIHTYIYIVYNIHTYILYVSYTSYVFIYIYI